MQSDSDASYFRLVQMQNELIKQDILLLIIPPGMWKSAPSLKWKQFAAIPSELLSLTLPGPTGGAYNTDRICIPEKS